MIRNHDGSNMNFTLRLSYAADIFGRSFFLKIKDDRLTFFIKPNSAEIINENFQGFKLVFPEASLNPIVAPMETTAGITQALRLGYYRASPTYKKQTPDLFQFLPDLVPRVSWPYGYIW